MLTKPEDGYYPKSFPVKFYKLCINIFLVQYTDKMYNKTRLISKEL